MVRILSDSPKSMEPRTTPLALYVPFFILQQPHLHEDGGKAQESEKPAYVGRCRDEYARRDGRVELETLEDQRHYRAYEPGYHHVRYHREEQKKAHHYVRAEEVCHKPRYAACQAPVRETDEHLLQ